MIDRLLYFLLLVTTMEPTSSLRLRGPLLDLPSLEVGLWTLKSTGRSSPVVWLKQLSWLGRLT